MTSYLEKKNKIKYISLAIIHAIKKWYDSYHNTSDFGIGEYFNFCQFYNPE